MYPVSNEELSETSRPTEEGSAPTSWHRSKRALYGALFAILLLSLVLRLHGIDWDQGGLFHPDERAVLMKVNDLDVPSFGDLPDLLDAEASTLNPRWFAYGSLPLYMLKGLSIVADPFSDWDIWDLRLTARAMSAFADTATVAVIFLLGRGWFGKRIGLLAALFAALAVLSIQLAHFFAVDTFLSLFVTAAVFFMIRVAYSGKRSDSLFAGILVGMAIGTKASALVLGVPLLASHLIFALSAAGDRIRILPVGMDSGAYRRWGRALNNLGLALASSVGVLVIVQPYMFLDWSTFFDSVSGEGKMVRRSVDLPYTRQYIDTPKFLYQVWQLGTYGLGPALGLVAWLGLASAAAYAWLTHRKADIVIFAWVVPYLLITGSFEVKFIRYMLPLVPFLILYGARMLIWIVDLSRSRFAGWTEMAGAGRYIGIGFASLVVVLTAHYALSYQAVYASPHPAQAAADWLLENTDRDVLVLKEHWEEGIPRLADRSREELEMYNPDDQFKFDRISEQLSHSDYLVFYSNRLFATLPRLPERYPVSARYYEKLFDGSLGYDLVRVEDSVPGFLGVSYDEATFDRSPTGPPVGYEEHESFFGTLDFGWADESFYVYDHPRTLIFANAERLSKQDIFSSIWTGSPPVEREIGLLLSDDDLAAQRAGGTFRDIATLPDSTNSYSWVLWLLAIQFIGLLAFPLGSVAFRPLAGRGYLLTKILGLLIVSFLAWFMASTGIMEFSRSSVLVSMAVLGLISAAIAWRNWGDLREFFRENGRLILLMEAIFLTAFLAFLLVRAANPDLWHPFRGGEKPMDFAYLNAVTRSSVMPPYDPWFAGGYLNYYYFGQFIVATMIRLTGIQPAVAFNLAIPMLFALSAGAIFTLVYALVEGARKLMPERRSMSAKGPIIAGLIAVLFILVAGNIDGLVQVVQGTARVVFTDRAFGEFDFWRSSRLYASESGNEITEFPFFTFLFADLHAHLIGIPFTLLALGLGISVFLRTYSPAPAKGAGTILTVVLLGLAIGALRIINAWDWPTYLTLGLLAIVAGQAMAPGRSVASKFRTTIGLSAGMLFVSHFAYLPFHQNFELFNDGLIQSETRSPLWRYWYVHSLFMFLILSYIGWQAKLAIPAVKDRLGMRLGELIPIPLGIVVFALALTVVGYGTVAFILLALLAIAALVTVGLFARTPLLRYELIVAALVGMGLAIGAAVDIVTVRGDIGRMNTVFKFYLQAWILMGLASGYIAWRFAESGNLNFRLSKPFRSVWVAGLSILAIGVLIYPVMGTRVRLRDRYQTTDQGLDGLAYMLTATQWEDSQPISLRFDLAAIKWLQKNIDGSPVIVEGITGLYHWGNRISINTGLPAIVGWDWHQRQQRVGYADEVMLRRRHVDRIYSTNDPLDAQQLMQEYDARYLVVGQLERITYPAPGLAKFEEMAEQGVMPIYRDDEVTIYRIAAPD